MKPLAVTLVAAIAFGCVDVDVDDDETEGNIFETDGPTVEFDPGDKIIPTPNTLLIEDDGLLDIPVRCGETPTTEAIRTEVLNQLDGFGTNRPFGQITFTTAVDPGSLGDRLKLYKRKDGDTEIDPLIASSVDITVRYSLSERFDPSCENRTFVNNLTFFPNEPLDEDSTYTAVLLEGVQDSTGELFLPSSTWALVRQATDPVEFDESGNLIRENTPLDPTDPDDFESLEDLDGLWEDLAPTMSFITAVLDVPRNDVLLAWDIKTQTIKEPLDRAIDGTPANTLPTMTPLLGSAGTPGMDVIANVDYPGTPQAPTPTQLFDQANPEICPATNACPTVGSIYAGAFVSPNYQVDTPNPAEGGEPVPGPWSDPLAPAKVGDAPITVLAFTPDPDVVDKPSGGWPVVIFSHGITRSRLDVFAVASQLTASGFAVIAHDWVAHGDPRSPLGAGRAVQIDFDSPQCQGEPDPTDRETGGITCYAGFFSSDLAATRDNFRQSALDTMALVNTLKTCSGGLCGGDFDIDSGRIGLLGHSLGGIVGSIVVAMSPDIDAAVLNVTGVGLTDIIESTQSKLLQCPLIDALIMAGVIDGDLSDPGSGTGTCFGDDWKTDPRWVAFANTARWILDPADSINYVDRLIGRAVFVQEVDEDETVPNVSTDNLTSLLGTNAVEADVYTGTPTPPNPTGAVITNSREPLHVRYIELATPAPNVFDHGSLLGPPADSGAAGQLGTARMQSDAFTYLVLSL